MDNHKKGILLVNLGSPDSIAVKDVRKYLREFLMDERVLDMPYLQRKLILELFILPSRPAKSAEAYQSIWWDEGSPLVIISRKVKSEMRKRLKLPIELGMRYGNPSIESALDQLVQKFHDLEEILLIPMYPHYAMSSYETAVVKTRQVVKKKFPDLKLHVQPPFYEEENYIKALAATVFPALNEPYDHVLFSYHGIPERHLKKSDPTRLQCLCSEQCCDQYSAASDTCYRYQVLRTTSVVAEKLGLSEGQYSVSFQSRLGRDPWLTPFTDQEIRHMPERGIHNLVVVCPSFVSDCLETLEEIGIAGRKGFMEAGGKQFTLVPCLNDHPMWIETLVNWCSKFSEKEKAVIPDIEVR